MNMDARLRTKNPQSTMLEAALAYARVGWPVFPCNPAVGPSCKQPLVGRDGDAEGNPIPNTGGLYKATTDEGQIRLWWTRWPNALIGVRTGAASGMFAIDPDAPKRPGNVDGRDAWNNLATQHSLPPTRTHVTPSGGLHVLFRWRPDCPVSNTAAGLPAGIDVRGEGGYIVAPPSRLNDGRSYASASDTLDVAEAPEWLYDLLLKPADESERNPKNADPGRRPGGWDQSHQRYAAAALERECASVAKARPGSRNNALNTAAFNLGTLVGADGLDRTVAEQRLLEAAGACGLLREDGRLAVAATIGSGLDAGLRSPRQLPPPSQRRGREAGPLSRSRRQTDGRNSAHDVITQDDAACEFVQQYAGRLRFCHSTARWFEWTGVYWRKDITELAFQFARTLGHELTEGANARALKEVRRTQFAKGVELFARGDQALATTIDEWDHDPFLLGTPGGTVDLRNGKLLAPRATDGITKLTAVAPADAMACPRWLSFMDETFGNAEVCGFVQQWCGYTLTGDVSEHALLFGSGAGGNGKSVFINTIAGLMGDYATTAAMDTFTASAHDRHTTELAMLRGARLVTVSETEEGRAWAENRIKQLTGGDPITARFMRQDNFTYKPTFKLTIVGNHEPELRNVDEAMRRRVNILPFSRRPAQPDRHLEVKLRGEWPGILRWMIQGCLDWQESGLQPPATVCQATEAYFAEQDLFGQWLEEMCDVEPGNAAKIASTTELFRSWSEFAKAAGENAGNTKSFASAMRRRGLKRYRSSLMRGYVGVRLRAAAALRSK
jgi:putative DNA primase/helicase